MFLRVFFCRCQINQFGPQSYEHTAAKPGTAVHATPVTQGYVEACNVQHTSSPDTTSIVEHDNPSRILSTIFTKIHLKFTFEPHEQRPLLGVLLLLAGPP